MNEARILIVEDERIVALSLQKNLRELGFHVIAMTGIGEQAIEWAIDHQPDLILMDVMLSGKLDGIATADEIRQQLDVPIIYLTAYSDEETLQRAKVTEPFAYLLKPFDEQTLKTTIEVSLYRHQMEKQLKESEAFFRLLFDAAPIGMVVAMPDGRFLRVNQAYCDIVGYSADELIGRHFADITYPEDIEPNLALNRQTVQSGNSQYEMEKRYIHKDGHIVHVTLHVNLWQNEKGQPQFIIGQIMDVTERVRVEAEKARLLAARELLLAETQKAHRIAETMQAANMALSQNLDLNLVLETFLTYLGQLIPYDSAVVMLVTEDGHLQVQAARDLHPLPSEKRDKLIQPPPLLERVVVEQRSLIIANTKYHPDWEYRASSAHVRSWLAVPLVAVQNTIGVYSLTKQESNFFGDEHCQWAEALSAQASVAIQNARLYTDVQAQMMALQEMQTLAIQNEKMSALGRLIASLAHEINNPIQAMQGCLVLGMEKLAIGDTSAADDYLQIVQTETDRVGRIVQNLRDFYRVTAEQMQPTDLESTLDSVLQLAWKQLEQYRIVVTRTAVTPLPTLMVNPNQLKQVFLNLILNAVDAMPHGGQLQLQTSLSKMPSTSRTPNADAVCITFNNSGEPIDTGVLPHLFEPFFTTKEQGSGLGLSISYGIIEAHGGQIIVTSDKQTGTTFTIWLPVQS